MTGYLNETPTATAVPFRGDNGLHRSGPPLSALPISSKKAADRLLAGRVTRA
jgi:hypothetical protein